MIRYLSRRRSKVPAGVSVGPAPITNSYFRPDGTSYYRRPDGTSIYNRP